MNDLDTRARAAASGLRRAVDEFQPTDTVPGRSRPRHRGLVIAAAGLVAGTLIVAGVLAWRSDTSSIRTVDHPPPTRIVSAQVGGAPIAITVDGRGVFVANETNEVVRLDRHRGRIAARVRTEQAVSQVATDPQLGIWAFGGAGPFDRTGDLTFLGPSTERPPATVQLEDGAVALAFTPDRVWFADHAGVLYRLDPRTLKVDSVASVPGNALDRSLVVAGGRLWLASANTLYPFDPDHPSLRMPDVPPVSDRFGGFEALASDGRWLWASVCADPGHNFSRTFSRGCVLERRDAKTGELLQRFTEQPLATNNGGDGAIVSSDGAVWAVNAEGSLIRTTPSGGVERVLSIPMRLRSADRNSQFRYFGVGAGALWYSVPEQGRVYRIPLS